MSLQLTPSKTTVVVAIAIVSIIFFTGHWFYNNARESIVSIEKKTTLLLKKENIPFKDKDVQEVILDINDAFANDKYATARPDLKAAFDKFTKAWKDSTKLTKPIIASYQPVLDNQFRTVKESYSHLAGNQLEAVLLEWFICILALGLCVFSNILRDPIGDQSKLLGQNRINGITSQPMAGPPFSLSRTQLVVWIAIIACVYTYAILWDSRDISVINQTALILMGISAGTFAAGAILDTAEIEQGIPRSQDEASNGFFKDILSDSKGISIHRFQNVVWTLVAIFIYFYRYANPPKNSVTGLPDLDSTLLALTGISSATYLMLKTRENLPTPNIVKTLKIALSVSPATSAGLPAATASNIQTNGLSKAIISITDQTGNTTHPIPDPGNPQFNFLASNIKPGAYTITVSWSDNPAPPIPAPVPPLTLTKTWEGPIDNSTQQPITIML